jgi:DNA-binding XRE family transcriptional regulator
MEKVQTFTTPSGEKMVILPKVDYDRLLSRYEDDEDDEDDVFVRDAREILKRVRAGTEPLIPLEVCELTFSGMSTLRAWRTWRKLSCAELARRIGKSQSYVTQIENGTRQGTLETMRRIAKALGTTVDALKD